MIIGFVNLAFGHLTAFKIRRYQAIDFICNNDFLSVVGIVCDFEFHSFTSFHPAYEASDYAPVQILRESMWKTHCFPLLYL